MTARLTGTSSMTVTGTNVGPTAAVTAVTASAPLVVTPQESISFAGSFSDPGKLGGRLTAAQAGTLRNTVHAVLGAMGVYNRFLEWWPLGA